MFGMKRSDAHLVGQVLRGNKEHYAPLVERYLPAVRSVARANAGPWADADDIAQETFVDAYRTLDKLRERSKFAHWLLRIARNKARDWADADRRERQKREMAGESFMGTSKVHTPEERELHALLHAELEAMPPEQREVLALFHLAGHGTREIAGMLDLSHDAVRKRLQRGREALGERMLQRMERPQSQDERGKRAKAISSIAIGSTVAWEVSAATGEWAVAAGWGMGGKIAASVSLCAIATGLFLMGDEPTDVTLAENVSQTADTSSEVDSERVVAEDGASNAAGVEPAASQAAPPLPMGNSVVFGTVYDLDDAPLPDTTVHLALHIAGESPMYQQRSDAGGNFRFEGLPDGNVFYTLWAADSGDQSAATTWEFLMEGHRFNQQFLELKPALPVTGKVLDEAGNPIPDAHVKPSRFRTKSGASFQVETSMSSVLTEAEGMFCIPFLERGEWYFDVSKKGFAPRVIGPVPTGTDAGSIVLLDGLKLSGTAMDSETQQPVAGVEIRSTLLADGPNVAHSAISNAQGRFEVTDLTEGLYNVEVQGNWSATPVRATMSRDAPVSDVVLLAERNAVVRGRVRDAQGRGVAGVEISAPVNGRPTVKSDEEGYYTVYGLGAGQIALQCSELLAEGSSVVLSLAKGEVKEGVDFVLETGERRVVGRVVDSSGKPMAGVRVEVFGQRVNTAPRTQVTDASGNFAITDLIGTNNDTMWVRGHLDGWVSRDLQIGLNRSDQENITLIMERPAGLVGRLVDANGKPMPGVSLALDGVDVRTYAARGAKTSGRGRFGIPHKVPGTYRVVETSQSGTRNYLGEVVLTAGEVKTDLILTYAPGASFEIKGRVVDESGKPMADVQAIIWHGNAQQGGYNTSSGDGVFSCSVPQPGLYTIQLKKGGYNTTLLEDVQADSEGLEAIMMPAGRVSGRVVATNGTPVSTVEIEWRNEQPDDLPGIRTRASTAIVDPEGDFTLLDLPTGTITIEASAEGYAPAFTTVELSSGENRTGVDLRLDTVISPTPEAPEVAPITTSLSGLVLNTRKEPVSGAYIYLNQRPHPTDRSGPARATSGPDGRFVINEVSLGTSRVLAWHKDYAPAGAALSLSDKAVHETTITMVAGGTLEGTLTGGGTALRDAHLSIDSTVLGERFYDNVYPDAKGFFSARHVAAGSTTINVHYKDRWYKFPANVVEGGASRADIDLQVGTSAIDGTLMLDGEPVEGEIAVVLPVPGGGEERFTCNTTRNGRFSIEELPEGPVELEALNDDGGAGRKVIALVAGEPLEVEVEVVRSNDENEEQHPDGADQ